MGKDKKDKKITKPTLPQKGGSRIVSFEKKDEKKKRKTHQDKNRQKKIAKYQSDSEEETDEDKFNKLNIKEESEDESSEGVVSMNDDDESPAIQLPLKDDSVGKKRASKEAGSSDEDEESDEDIQDAEQQPAKRQKKAKQDEEGESSDEGSGSEGEEEDDEFGGSSADDEGDLPLENTTEKKKKKTYADKIADILGADVPQDTQGNVKLLVRKTPNAKEKKELDEAIEAERERKAAARKKELRYKIANKNHLVPNITTNSSAEKALKKLATQGVVRLFNAMKEARKGYVAPTREKKVLVVKKGTKCYAGASKEGAPFLYNSVTHNLHRRK